MMVTGLLMAVAALEGLGVGVFLSGIVVIVVVPVAYSYLLYRKIEGFKNGGPKG